MSKSSDNPLASLRHSIVVATAARTERALIGLFDEDLGYGATFESPIELMFFYAFCAEVVHAGQVVRFVPGRNAFDPSMKLILESPKGGVLYTRDSPTGQFQSDALGSSDGIVLGPVASLHEQIAVFSQVEHAGYRVDFLIVDQWGCRVVVECDGHDFHERTKEQAKRDRRRDRTLIRDGLPCLRFTGSELFGDATGCAREVLSYFERELDRAMGVT